MNRLIAPNIILPKQLAFENVEKVSLDNNFPLYVLSGSKQNIFQLDIVFKAGRFFESKRMLAGLCANMVLKGTAKKKAFEIAESFDFYGAAIKFTANMYTAQLTMYCLTNELPELLPLLMEVLEEASFPEKELKKIKSKTKQKLATKWERNSFIASQNFNQAIFGSNHAFGYFSEKHLIDNIERDDLVNHFQNHFKLKEDTFGLVAGKIGSKELQLLNQYFGKLKVHASEKHQGNFQPLPEKEHYIDAKNKLQAAIRVGMPTINASHTDFENLQIMNTIFGGYFGSRLMSNIREEKGYTYGIYSFVNPIMDTSYFCISTEVGANYKNQTLDEIQNEINRLKKELIKEEELAMVKNYMVGQLMKSVDGPLNRISTLKNFLIFDLDLDEINKQLQAIHQIDAPTIQKLAQQYLDYDNMYKVVVG